MSSTAREHRDDLRRLKARWHDDNGADNPFPHDRLLVYLEQFDDATLEAARPQRTESLPHEPE